ncbi:disintegrin and metalloproteinase domain-containing protein 19 isoform X2 [Paramormyrops kingsleyae]|uniref:disintegrin and metalloproteinase domain-containing protein 19 isoform X2 n=1 Tax=Paramormyrops kingsleyae TaxID=1676925 RepID=UPI003B970E77
MILPGCRRWLRNLIALNCSLYVCVFSFLVFKCTASRKDAYSDDRWLGKQHSIDQYGIIHPMWSYPARHRRSPGNPADQAWDAEVIITAEGRQLMLQLQRNKYKETWYSPDGARRTFSPHQESCFFHGVVAGEDDSSVAVSGCGGLRGLITVNSSMTYLIEPLAGRGGLGTSGHAVYRAEHLRLPKGTCGHRHNHAAQVLEDLIHGMAQAPPSGREKRDMSGSMKYVELLLVADHAEFQKHGRDYQRTRMKLLEAANHVDKFYKGLDIRVALIGLEIWTDEDKISVSANPYSTLGSFLAWRRKQLRLSPNDNAQLITGISFQGTTIGLAPLNAMCSEYQSGGVNSDHSESAVGVAATMAHEMGHNFGMSHDTPGCCLARANDGGCIMAASTGHPFPKVFNACNKKELQRYLSSGGGKCLSNPPNTSTMYGGPRCGNGYLEDGEECDCGDAEECSSPCCNAHNCTLKAGAQCAHGVCCENCKLKSPGVLCRPASGSCDLPEYCDGKSESCPANFYLMDGTTCLGGLAYCYTGMCLTLEQQCLSLWGQGASPAPDLCFMEVNKAGDSYGNCGKDTTGEYRRCRERDVKCGKIQCLSTAPKPLERNAVAIDTNIPLGVDKVLCRGTHVYQSSQGDTLDPGLVMTGTKCGQNGICFEGECRNASFLQANDCSSKCHSHGLCNNNHNCHCTDGWSPPSCVLEGTGGSIDSGPVPPRSRQLLLCILPFVFLGLGAAALWYSCKKRRWHKRNHVPSSTSTVPVSHGALGTHVNQQKKQGPDGEVGRRQSPAGPSRVRSSIVRPTEKPPPVPAYALPQKTPRIPPSRPPPVFQQPISVSAKPRPEPPQRPPPPHVYAEEWPQPDPNPNPNHEGQPVPPKGHKPKASIQNDLSGES